MAEPIRYEFSYITPAPEGDQPTSFALGGISDDVAKGIRYGLRQVPTITNVTAQRVIETREAVSGTT